MTPRYETAFASINELSVAVDDVFTSECVVLVKRFVRSKAVSIDGQ
jgi:hypothetical protein